MSPRTSARFRGPRLLVSFAASYAIRRPAAFAIGLGGALSMPLAVAATPLVAAWSMARAATGAFEALRVGLRARRAPVLVRRADLLTDLDALAAVCTLVSDTHVTTGGRIPSELSYEPSQWPDDDPPDGAALEARLARVLAHVEAHAPRVVVWAGDEVDSGQPAEWAAWRRARDAAPGLAHRLIPGNHDISFNPELDEDHTLARRAVRERSYQAHGGPLADFPLVDTIVGDAGPVTLILLDSCRHGSTHALSNAVGQFGEVQLAELARVLASVSGPVMCVAHHHVWRDERFLQPEEWFNIAVDADDFSVIVAAYAAREPHNQVLVCHGHRHVLTTGEISPRVAVLGMPSTTLGDKGDRNVLDGVLRYAVPGLRSDRTWGVALVEVAPAPG